MLDEKVSAANALGGHDAGQAGAPAVSQGDPRRAATVSRATSKKNPLEELDDDIATLEEKLRKVKDRRKEALKAQRAKNEKALIDLVRSQKWEDFPAETWIAIAGPLDKLLKGAVVSTGIDPAQNTLTTG